MKVISLRDAEQWYATQQSGGSLNLNSIITEKESGQRIDEQHIQSIAIELLGQARSVQGNRKDSFMEFEAEASIILHSELNLSNETVASREFWVWASLAVFKDLIETRHPGESGALSMPDNYGFRGRWNGLIFRLWSRGDQGFNPEFDLDPYYHSRLGHVDMWRSHILRVDHGSCREVSHAFLREAYDSKLSTSGAPLSTATVRKVAKSLRKLHATMPLELLSRSEAERLVREEIERVKAE